MISPGELFFMFWILAGCSYENDEIRVLLPLTLPIAWTKKSDKNPIIQTNFEYLLLQRLAVAKKDYSLKLTSKLSSMSILHRINHLNGEKLSQIKHALRF